MSRTRSLQTQNGSMETLLLLGFGIDDPQFKLIAARALRLALVNVQLLHM